MPMTVFCWNGEKLLALARFLAQLRFPSTPKAQITGIYLDAKNVLHGFLRYPDGAFATLMRQAPATKPVRVLVLSSSAQRARLLGSTLTRRVYLTAFCGLLIAGAHSIFITENTLS